jgi:hypothetical protein
MGIGSAVILVYLVCHIPAFILLILGIRGLRKGHSNAKKLLIIARIYFIVGAGICGGLLGGF